MSKPDRYSWPASAISQHDMALLYAARESTRTDKIVPISVLVAQAIRQVYGMKISTPAETKEPAAKAA